MSFLEALQKQKSELKCSDTIVKTAGGEIFLERRNSKGVFLCDKISSSYGFVVDLNPDLEVASVLPGLFMGSQDVTQDFKLLKSHNITHVLSVGIKVCEYPGIKYFFIDALDLPEFDILQVFDQSTKLIDDVRSSGGSVFVHCNAGISRSAAIVIAYLMITEKFRFQQALDLLKKVRSCVKPNEGFIKQLILLENNLFSK